MGNRESPAIIHCQHGGGWMPDEKMAKYWLDTSREAYGMLIFEPMLAPCDI
jgi:hypothetical protein